MKTITTKSVWEAIVLMRGVDPATAAYSAAQNALIAVYINERVVKAWQRAFWAEIMLAEQRQYRATWDATLNYATGDEVYYETSDGSELYYISLQDGNVNYNPETETDWWEEVGDGFLRTIDFEQEGETEIGAVDLQFCIFDQDPRIYRFSGLVLDVMFYGDGILLSSNTAPARPWVWFRPPVRAFSLTEWSGATLYAIGDLSYLASTGLSYKALQTSTNKNPESETDYWEPVEFPAFLKTYVSNGAHADYLVDPVETAKFENKAEAELESLEQRLLDQQGVERKAVFGR